MADLGASKLIYERKKQDVYGVLRQAAKKINPHGLSTLETQLRGNARGLIKNGRAFRKNRQNSLFLPALGLQQDEGGQLLNDAREYARSLGTTLYGSGMGSAIDSETPPLFTGHDYYPTDDSEFDSLIQQEDPDLYTALLNNNTVEGPPY